MWCKKLPFYGFAHEINVSAKVNEFPAEKYNTQQQKAMFTNLESSRAYKEKRQQTSN